MLHKVKSIDYIQVCTDRLAEILAMQHDEKKQPVIQGLFDNKVYASAVK